MRLATKIRTGITAGEIKQAFRARGERPSRIEHSSGHDTPLSAARLS